MTQRKSKSLTALLFAATAMGITLTLFTTTSSAADVASRGDQVKPAMAMPGVLRFGVDTGGKQALCDAAGDAYSFERDGQGNPRLVLRTEQRGNATVAARCMEAVSATHVAVAASSPRR